MSQNKQVVYKKQGGSVQMLLQPVKYDVTLCINVVIDTLRLTVKDSFVMNNI